MMTNIALQVMAATLMIIGLALMISAVRSNCKGEKS